MWWLYSVTFRCWKKRKKISPAVAVIKGLKDLLVSPACRRLYVGQEPCSCEQVDVGILWGTQRGAQTDWGGRWGRGYTDREVNQENGKYLLSQKHKVNSESWEIQMTLRNIRWQQRSSGVAIGTSVAEVCLPQVTTADVTAGTARNVLTCAALPSRSSVKVGLWTCAIILSLKN